MKRIIGITAAAAVLGLAGAAQGIHVNVELSLLVDVSGSISNAEWQLQRDGYAQAFQTMNFNAIVGTGNSIAVNFVEWSNGSQQSQRVGWTLISNQAEAVAFGNAIAAIGTRAFNENTGPQSALKWITDNSGSGADSNSFQGNNFTSDMQIIDVSGDGVRNDGLTGTQGRDWAVAAGIDQINGLVIGGDNTVFQYYQQNIQAGTNSFVNAVANFSGFAAAIREKIHLEVSQTIPLPGVAGMAGVGLGLVAIRRRRAA